MPQGSPAPDEPVEQKPESTALTPIVETPSKADRLVSVSDIAVLDTAKYDQMWRVATAIAQSALVPETLRGYKENGVFQTWAVPTIIANCFKVVNQAVRWNMDPFALIDCASIIHGRLCWEGKVIAAVLDAMLGIELDYAYEGQGDLMKITVSGTLPNGKVKTITGTVAQWKTTGAGSPWSKASDNERSLAYRGNREWARRHKPSVMLGVYGTDEPFDDTAPTPLVAEAKPMPPAAPPPRRVATQTAVAPPPDMSMAQTAAEPPIKEMAPPAAPPPRNIKTPIKGNPKPPKAAKAPGDEWAGIDDIDIRDWLRDFKTDLRDCRNVNYINILVDRRQETIDRLPEIAKKKATELINNALSEIQR